MAQRYYRLSQGQIQLAATVTVFTQLLEMVFAGSTGLGRYLRRLARLMRALVGGMLWFSIGWLATAEHDLDEREALLVGGSAAMVAGTFDQLVRGLRFTLRPDPRRRTRSGFALLLGVPFGWFISFLFGGLLASLGAREARRRG